MPPTAACRSVPAEPPSLWRLDREAETVILARTFSKTFSPGLKIGFGVLPRRALEPILCPQREPRFRLGQFQPAAPGADSWPTAATTAMSRA